MRRASDPRAPGEAHPIQRAEVVGRSEALPAPRPLPNRDSPCRRQRHLELSATTDGRIGGGPTQRPTHAGTSHLSAASRPGRSAVVWATDSAAEFGTSHGAKTARYAGATPTIRTPSDRTLPTDGSLARSSTSSTGVPIDAAHDPTVAAVSACPAAKRVRAAWINERIGVGHTG